MSFPLKQTFWPSLNASIWLILTSSWLYSIDYKAKGSIFKVRKSFSLLFIPAFSMQKWTKYMYVMFLICKSLQSKHVSNFFKKSFILWFMLSHSHLFCNLKIIVKRQKEDHHPKPSDIQQSYCSSCNCLYKAFYKNCLLCNSTLKKSNIFHVFTEWFKGCWPLNKMLDPSQSMLNH